MQRDNAPVVVIGAGMIGAAVALHAAEAGLPVLVLEAEQPARGATGNSFSWLNAVGKQPRSYHRLNAAGMAEYERMHDALPAGEPRGPGCLEWALPGAAADALRLKVHRLHDWDYAARLISRAEAQEREPRLIVAPS